MTGLFGAFHLDGTPVVHSALQRMQDFLTPLGPEGQRLTFDSSGSAAIGHTLQRVTYHSEHEQQPLTRHQVTITAHARLDARDTLVSELRSIDGAAGDDLHDHAVIPDSDLILRAYLAWGDDCMHHLQGDYAVVLWDDPRHRLIVFCDRFSRFTLAYSFAEHPQLGRVFVFANRLAALIEYPTVDITLSETAIGHYLMLGTTSAIDRRQTIYSGAFALQPAELVIVDDAGMHRSTYWTLSSDYRMLRYRTEREYVEHYKTLLWQAVEERLHVDHALISMSGGLNSTSIAAIAVDLAKQGRTNARISPIAAVYDRIHPDNDEAYYAHLVGLKLGLPVDFSVQDAYTITEPLPLGDQPGSHFIRTDSAQSEKYSTRFLLNGHAADEAFRPTDLIQTLTAFPPRQAVEIGAWLWRTHRVRPGIKRTARFFRARLLGLIRHQPAPSMTDVFPFPVWMRRDFAAQLHLVDQWQSFWVAEETMIPHGQFNAYRAFVTNEYGGLNGTLRPPTTAPVWTAIPFMDFRVLEFMLSLPPAVFNYDKRLLRQTMIGYLPEEVRTRPKVVLGTLLLNMLRLPSASWVDTWEPIDELTRYVDRAAIPKLTGDTLDPMISHGGNLRPLALNHWLREFRAVEPALRARRAGD